MRFQTKMIFATLLVSVLGVGCSPKEASYSILSTNQEFSQATQDNKVDVLWVIDNSGSMAPSQQNLADNFPSFIQNFENAKFDFNIAVTTSDAFKGLPEHSQDYDVNNPYWENLPAEYKSRFRDGLGATHSGYYILNPLTPNLHNNFITNIMQGTSGSGDERSLQSMKAALNSSLNAGFLRPGVFLAVIIVTDEEDFSHPGNTLVENYSYPTLYTVDSYKEYLDNLTLSSEQKRNYSVNSVTIQDLNDPTCAGQLHAVSKVPLRIHELVDKSGGKRANLCGDFANELDGLAGNIVQLAAQFSLGGANPVPSTIKVFVDGAELPASDWTYIEASNAIQFSEGHVPPSGSDINVTFDPKEVTF
ncbi:MAG: hypothetical protein CL676_11750 [Bdellovibrionaceae bacterium]|nr:hypothetical protein [Pseudobdellovibrionaceae bacterium]|tara:strand:- start:3704 stop:4786 length:1083 start_codon:yes stop_codon:yes gene_type:complete